MTLERLIELDNDYLKKVLDEAGIDKTFFLVLHKQTIPHKTFKVYKDVKYTVYAMDSGNKHKVLEHSQILKTDNDSIEKFEEEFYKKLLYLINTESFMKIVKGVYETD